MVSILDCGSDGAGSIPAYGPQTSKKWKSQRDYKHGRKNKMTYETKKRKKLEAKVQGTDCIHC